MAQIRCFCTGGTARSAPPCSSCSAGSRSPGATRSTRPSPPAVRTLHWLLDPDFPLQQAARQKVRRAVAAVRRHSTGTPSPGQIIAELPLGFWRFPTMRGYRATVWAPYLSRAFPHAGHRPLQEDVDRRLQPIILMRNRVAHHEPVFARPAELRALVEDVVELGSWSNPQAADWWARHTAAGQVLDLAG